MKVKGATEIWLLVWNKGKQFLRVAMSEHYFPTKGRSICGKVAHPKSQPMAAYIQNERCKACEKALKFEVKMAIR